MDSSQPEFEESERGELSSELPPVMRAYDADSRVDEVEFRTPGAESRFQESPSCQWKDTTQQLNKPVLRDEENNTWEPKSNFLKPTDGVPEGLTTGDKTRKHYSKRRPNYGLNRLIPKTTIYIYFTFI